MVIYLLLTVYVFKMLTLFISLYFCLRHVSLPLINTFLTSLYSPFFYFVVLHALKSYAFLSSRVTLNHFCFISNLVYFSFSVTFLFLYLSLFYFFFIALRYLMLLTSSSKQLLFHYFSFISFTL